MDRRVDEEQLWIRALQTLHRPGATVSGTVVDDPEDAASIVVWGSSHYLLDKAVKRCDAVLRLAASKDPGVVHVQTGDVGPGPAAKVFMLHLHRATRATGTSRVLAPSGLNAGFLVCRDHELIILQRVVFPRAGIQVENATGFVGKMGIAWEDPTPVVPGANSVLM